jgi:histidinol-phosphate aminotransferase
MTIQPSRVVRKLVPYVPGLQPKTRGYLKLNSNENPYPPAPQVLVALQKATDAQLRVYPDPVCTGLRSTLAQRLKIPATRLIIGNGSDEILRLICQAYIDPGTRIGMLAPTYTLFETLGQMFRAKLIPYPLDDNYSLPSAVFSSREKVFFLANPNSPVGTFYPPRLIARLLRCRPRTLFVVDEAYVDFAPQHCLGLLRRFGNLIITRTLSKSYSLAGLRIGFAVANAQIISQLYKIKDSYNVNRLSQVAAEAALRAAPYFRRNIQRIKQTRARVRRELQHLGFRVPPSQANFLFAIGYQSYKIYQQLKARKILVRYFKLHPHAPGLRISIGTEQEMSTLLRALKKMIRGDKP